MFFKNRASVLRVLMAAVCLANFIKVANTESIKTYTREDQDGDGCDRSQFECENGKCIDIFDVCNGINNCKDGGDEIEDTCDDWTNVKKCELKDKIPIRYDCEFNGVPIPCEQTTKVWTTVKIHCNIGYVPKNDILWVDRNKCLPSGEWLYPMPSCTYGNTVFLFIL